MQKKILIIDGDETILKEYKEMFTPEDINVVTATTGQKGIMMVQSEKPDLILLGIMLPGGLNGFDVLEQLKLDPSTKQIPVIVLTNLDSEKKVAKEIGVKNYLVKANTTKEEIIKLSKDYLK